MEVNSHAYETEKADYMYHKGYDTGKVDYVNQKDMYHKGYETEKADYMYHKGYDTGKVDYVNQKKSKAYSLLLRQAMLRRIFCRMGRSYLVY